MAPDGTATKISDGVLVGSQRRLDPHKSWTDAHGAMIRPFPTQERSWPLCAISPSDYYAWPESPEMTRTLERIAADRTRVIPLVAAATSTNRP